MRKAITVLATAATISLVAIGASHTKPADTSHTSVRNLPVAERPVAKAREIAKIGRIAREQRKGFEIEIVELAIIEGGVEAYVRAWRNGKPVGFGADGTVEIERFRIYNPPVLVPDPNGDILDVWVDASGETHSRRLREDPREALLQVIEHDLSVMKNIHGPKAIEKGRRGRTTSTFFSSAGDGHLRFFCNATWSNCRNATTADENSGSDTNGQWGVRGNVAKYIKRVFLPFDTSPLPDTDVISSATLSLVPVSSTSAGPHFYVTPQTQSSTASLSNDDFDNVTVNNSPLYSAEQDQNWTADVYKDVPLNSTGIAAISPTGNTLLGLRVREDLNDTDGVVEKAVTTYWSERTGTTQDPKLVIEHTAPAAASPADLILFE